MKDYFRNKLKIGDTVLFALVFWEDRRLSYITTKIIAFDPKREAEYVLIETSKGSEPKWVYPERLIKYNNK